MTRLLVVMATVLGMAVPACAEHMTLVDQPGAADVRASEPSRTLDLDIKLGANAFRIGGRWFGEAGVGGAWLNGKVGPNGFSLDGRVQGDTGRAYNFKVDAEVTQWLTTSVWGWLLR